ncbi:MAG: menaquinone biosynthesis protein [bacterium]|nr:menaquinone biosynthesis protein [bacterium]
MERPLRIGAVSYLNTRPLVHGLGGEDGIDLSFDVPAALSERMLRGELDVALLPVIELARMPQLELVPGLSIATRGAAASVLLVTRREAGEVRRVALDVESRTSNALTRVLFAEVWGAAPEFVEGIEDIDRALADCDAVVRIGDKALFEPLPEGCTAYDLGQAWTDATGLPFVFAAWAARPGVVTRELYAALHRARQAGVRAVDEIAAGYRWNGDCRPQRSAEYLRNNIRFRLGAAEVEALRRFLAAAAKHGIIDGAPEIRLAPERVTRCHEEADRLRHEVLR